jgi:hypothetical protein
MSRRKSTEPTALERQRIAFAYLREHAVNAHVAGDGLLANLLSHNGIDRVLRLAAQKRLLLPISELAWMPILAMYWLVNPTARYVVQEWLGKFLTLDTSDAAVVEWLKLHNYLIEQPLLSQDDLSSRMLALPWPPFFAAHSPEGETLITHLVELAWFHAPAGDGWKQVVEAWKNQAPEWTRSFLVAVEDRLLAQTKLTAPTKTAPIYSESAAETVRPCSPFAELWLLHLHGRSTQVCSVVERLTPRISPDSHDWRVLGDFMHFDGALLERDESQSVHLARRRRLSADTPLLIFHDSRENRIDDALLELFRIRSESKASNRWEIFTLAMLHELSALRLWDYGMWVQAIKAQAETTLEAMQWTDGSPGLSAHGLVLAVRGFVAKDPNKDYLTRRAIDTLEFAAPEVLDKLAADLLATYPRQKRGAADLLDDLTDLLPSAAWPELAAWTVSYARESAESRTQGWTMAPISHWLRALPVLAIDSPVWTILQPETVKTARISHCWQSGEAATFLQYWLVFAPASLAREVGAVIAEHPETDAGSCVARAELLIDLEETHPEFRGVFTRGLLSTAHSATESLLLARHLEEPDLTAHELAFRNGMSQVMRDTIDKATASPEVNQHSFGAPRGIHLVTSWLPEDEPLLRDLIAAIDSPNVLGDYLPWLIQALQLLVANGPVEFASIVQPAVARWTNHVPTGRSIFGHQSGPFSTVHFSSNPAEDVGLILGWLAFQLPRRLGTAAHENVLTWVRQMLLLSGIKPLEMAVYGSAVVALQANESASNEALSLFETAIISLWARSGESYEAASSLASALRRLSNVVGSETSDILPERSEAAIRVRRLAPALTRFLPYFARSPRASLRAAVASLLWQLQRQGEHVASLSQLLETLKNDNRARVRFEASGGWTARRNKS